MSRWEEESINFEGLGTSRRVKDSASEVRPRESWLASTGEVEGGGGGG